MDVDALAAEIRRVDGDHSLGAGALAEALLPWLTSLAPRYLYATDVTHVEGMRHVGNLFEDAPQLTEGNKP